MKRDPQSAALGIDADARDEGAQHLPALLRHERLPDLIEGVEQLGHVLALGAERRAGAETRLEVRDTGAVLVRLAFELAKALGEEASARVDAAEGTEQALGLGADSVIRASSRSLVATSSTSPSSPSASVARMRSRSAPLFASAFTGATTAASTSFALSRPVGAAQALLLWRQPFGDPF